MIKTFVLRRTEDVSGTSGTGDVADGVVFEDGTTVMHWRGSLASTAIYQSYYDVIKIHGHEDRTKIVWL